MNAYYKGNGIFGLRGPAGPDGNPIGTIISFMGLTAPKDYLICDGSLYNISDYPNLAGFFKDQFGSETYFGSNGEGTFVVPDMRNLFLRGYHGEADETLSGDVGKKQEGTVFPNIATGNLYALVFPNIAVSYENRDSLIGYVPNGERRYILSENTNHEQSATSNAFTSRPVNMAVLYCIKAVDSQTVYETIEEYDTTVDDCQWHVRKWSNGYCELLGKKRYLGVNTDTSWGTTFYISSDDVTIGAFNFPFPLIERYNEQCFLTDGSVPCFMISRGANSPGLTRTNRIAVLRLVVSSIDFTVNFYVTGRWKKEYAQSPKPVQDSSTNLTSSVDIPKKSGTLTHDGVQYDYDLRSDTNISHAASSAAKRW